LPLSCTLHLRPYFKERVPRAGTERLAVGRDPETGHAVYVATILNVELKRGIFGVRRCSSVPAVARVVVVPDTTRAKRVVAGERWSRSMKREMKHHCGE
jgi:hypothetical protein